MWYDIEKHAENAMKGADKAIRSAEQANLDPPWDGFCGLVRVCDDEELKERGVIRAVVRSRPHAQMATSTPGTAASAAHPAGTVTQPQGTASCSTSAAAASVEGKVGTAAAAAAAAALSDWFKHPAAGLTPQQQQQLPYQQQQQQQQLPQQQHGLLTPWQGQGTNSSQHPITAEQQQQDPQQIISSKYETQQQARSPALPPAQLQGRSVPAVQQEHQQLQPKPLLPMGSFSSSDGDDDPTGGDLLLVSGATAAAPPEWVTACLLGPEEAVAAGGCAVAPTDTNNSSDAAAADETPKARSGPTGGTFEQHQQQEQQQEQQQQAGEHQQQQEEQHHQQEDVDRLLQEVFAAAEAEVRAEESAAAPAAAADAVLQAATADGGASPSSAPGQPEVPVAAAEAAASAAEASLQLAPDQAAVDAFGAAVERATNLIDLDSNSEDSNAGGWGAAGKPNEHSEVEALLSAADEAAVLEAKHGVPGIGTQDLLDLPKLEDSTVAAVGAGRADTSDATVVSELAPNPAAAAGTASSGITAEAGSEPIVGEEGTGAVGLPGGQEDEVEALLAAAAEDLALEAKHGPGPMPAAVTADVAARVSALGVQSAAGLQPEGEQGQPEDDGAHGAAQQGDSGDEEDCLSDSEGSSSDSSQEDSYDSSGDEEEWLDELPSAPSHTAAGQQDRARPGTGRGRGAGAGCGHVKTGRRGGRGRARGGN